MPETITITHAKTIHSGHPANRLVMSSIRLIKGYKTIAAPTVTGDLKVLALILEKMIFRTLLHIQPPQTNQINFRINMNARMNRLAITR